MEKTINIARDFSRYPYGRHNKFSNTSGERFRDDYLMPLFKDPQITKIRIELDGTEGYGSTFLDEAFAGLVRTCGIDKNEVLDKLTFISNEDPSLVKETTQYIQEV